MFRLEPEARLRCDERKRPDPRHRGIDIVERTYVLVTGVGADGEVDLPPGTGEAVLVGQSQRPVLVAETEGRYWWMYEDRLYSAAEWLSRGTVTSLAEGRLQREDLKPKGRLRGRAALSLTPPAGLAAIVSDFGPLLGV